MTVADHETAIVLPGGGARAAYQIGVLRAIARIVGRGGRSPFPVICGTSAGAINAATLAVHADSFRRGVARLIRLWRSIGIPHVYRSDLRALSRHGVRCLAAVAGGAAAPERAVSMLDNTPLRALLARQLRLAVIEDQIHAGNLHALALNATSYTTGHAVTFYQGAPSIARWHRTRRRGEPCLITVDHLMASAAIPFVFPAVPLHNEYFADGSVRQIAPLSPALHLGAKRILVVAVGQFQGQRAEPYAGMVRYPSFAQIAGHALSSIFLDNMGADVERLQQLNRLVDAVPDVNGARHRLPVRKVNVLVLSPSRDLGEMALQFAPRLPRGVRYLLRVLGSTQGTGANLLSYLLFDRDFCRRLLALGYRDTIARRHDVKAFFSDSALRQPAATAYESVH